MNIFTKAFSQKPFSPPPFFKILLVLFVLGAIGYANAVRHPFVHDDVVFIQHNKSLGTWGDLHSVFFPSPEPTIVNNYYRPLLEIISKVQYGLFALNPHGYHLFNIILHIVNSFLIYVLIFLLSELPLFSLCVAALFLIHPAQSEAVAAIAGISNLSFSFFFLASFILYLYSVRRNFQNKNILVYAASLLFFFSALLAKEQAIILPAIIILYELCFPDARSVRIKSLRVAGVLAVGLGYLWVRKIILGSSFSIFLMYREELYLRVLSIPKILVTYLRLLISPSDLHYYRCINILDPYLKYVVLLAVIVGAIIVIFRKLPPSYWRRLIFALGWFVITLLPTLNIIPMIEEYSFIWTAEHFLYLPLFGFLFFTLTLAGYALKKFFKTKTNIAASVLFLSLCAVFTGMTVGQNAYWKGEIPLFEHAIRYENRLGRLHILLARAYYFDRQYDKAIEEYRIALGILEGYLTKTGNELARRFYVDFIKEIHFDLAHCYEAKNDLKHSIAEYQKMLEIDPDDSTVYNSLGTDYLYLNRVGEAAECFNKALALNPRNLMAMSNLAVCYIYQGKTPEAERLLRRALMIDKNFTTARQNLELLLHPKK